MRVHPVATGGNDPRGTNPEDRLLEAFSCLSRADREVAMLAIHAEAAGDDGRAEALEETIRAIGTARKHLHVATREWLNAQAAYNKSIIVGPTVRDAEKLQEASHHLDGVRDTDGER